MQICNDGDRGPLHACQNLLYMNSAAKQSVKFLHLNMINKVGKDKEVVFL